MNANPATYPNLEYTKFTVKSTSGPSSITLSDVDMLQSPIPQPYDFGQERAIINAFEEEKKKEEKEEERLREETKEKKEARKTPSPGPSPGTAPVPAPVPVPTVAAVEVTAEETSQKSGGEEEVAKSKSTGGVGIGIGIEVKRAMMQRMRSLTMADEETCETFLTDNQYNLENAVGDYYSKN